MYCRYRWRTLDFATSEAKIQCFSFLLGTYVLSEVAFRCLLYPRWPISSIAESKYSYREVVSTMVIYSSHTYSKTWHHHCLRNSLSWSYWYKIIKALWRMQREYHVTKGELLSYFVTFNCGGYCLVSSQCPYWVKGFPWQLKQNGEQFTLVAVLNGSCCTNL